MGKDERRRAVAVVLGIGLTLAYLIVMVPGQDPVYVMIGLSFAAAYFGLGALCTGLGSGSRGQNLKHPDPEDWS